MEDKNMEKGLIHLYIGEGKGKTTAAVGLAARAAGNGRRVVFGQLLKGGETGEIASLKALGVRVIRSEKENCFTWEMDEQQKAECEAEQMRLFDEIREVIREDEALDLLVVDEALDVVAFGALDEQSVKDVFDSKPETLEVVCTGRGAPDWLIEKADYVTEMRKIKHPFDRGIKAREAIEY